MIGWRATLVAGLIGGCFQSVIAAPLPADAPGARQEAERLNNLPSLPPGTPGHIDHTGRNERGRASYYAKHFAHRKMADGRRMNPQSNVAASKTLPLGSVAKVKNLENGKTATVKIEDRGPYVNGRVVDLAPKVASDLDFQHKGTAPVVVKPITVPQADGQVKLGAGAAEASPQEVQQAVAVSKELVGQKSADAAAK